MRNEYMWKVFADRGVDVTAKRPWNTAFGEAKSKAAVAAIEAVSPSVVGHTEREVRDVHKETKRRQANATKAVNAQKAVVKAVEKRLKREKAKLVGLQIDQAAAKGANDFTKAYLRQFFGVDFTPPQFAKN